MELAGKLLVATPLLGDPSFARTVVQLLEHDEGALGVVLNRPSAVELQAAVPAWAGLSPEPAVLFEGGPVSPGTVLCLARLAPGAALDDRTGAVTGAPWLATVDLDAEPADGLLATRVYAGYSGWSPGQLEDEVAEGAWWVLEALPEDPFVPEPSSLWQRVLRRQPPPLCLAATLPEDPALN